MSQFILFYPSYGCFEYLVDNMNELFREFINSNKKIGITCSSDACSSSLLTISIISEMLRFKKSSDNDISEKY